MGVTSISTNDALVELAEDGVKWIELPFVGTISATGAEAPETEVNAFRGSGKIAGRERVASLSLSVASYVPHHRAWRIAAKASREGRRLNWRVTTLETIIQAAITNTTVALATSGLVTVGGTAAAKLNATFLGEDFGLGVALQIASKLYSVDFIGDGTLQYEGNAVDKGKIYVSDPAQDADASKRVADAVNASASYKFVIPAMRLGPFLASPSGRGNFEMATESPLTASTTLTPSVQPEFSMHVEKAL